MACRLVARPPSWHRRNLSPLDCQVHRAMEACGTLNLCAGLPASCPRHGKTRRLSLRRPPTHRLRRRSCLRGRPAPHGAGRTGGRSRRADGGRNQRRQRTQSQGNALDCASQMGCRCSVYIQLLLVLFHAHPASPRSILLYSPLP